MCRLAAAHRVTQDVDTVAETTEPTAVELIATTIGNHHPSNPTQAFVDGILIDMITVGSFQAEDIEDLPPSDQLFLVSHRWALDTATQTELVAGTKSASIQVASPAALVAMKAGAILSGRRRQPPKQASDAYDLYRLILEYDRFGGLADELSDAPFGLGQLVAHALEMRAEQAARSVRLMMSGGPETRSVTAQDLRDVLDPLVERLR